MTLPDKKQVGNYVIRYEQTVKGKKVITFGETTLTLANAQSTAGMLNRRHKNVAIHTYVTLEAAEEERAAIAAPVETAAAPKVDDAKGLSPEVVAKFVAQEDADVKAAASTVDDATLDEKVEAAVATEQEKIHPPTDTKKQQLNASIQAALEDAGLNTDEAIAAILPMLTKNEQKIPGIGKASLKKIKAVFNKK